MDALVDLYNIYHSKQACMLGRQNDDFKFSSAQTVVLHHLFWILQQVVSKMTESGDTYLRFEQVSNGAMLNSLFKPYLIHLSL